MPSAPSDEIPPLPSLHPISIPDFAPLEFQEFTGTIPSPVAETGFVDFEWTEPGYTPEVRTEVVSQIKAILGGSTGIPDLIWNMIEARARQQLRATARQAKEEATTYWASRGHFLSNGQLRKRVDIASEVEREGVSELVRELVIQDAKIYVERLNTALAQGIALEDHLVRLYNTITDREFRAKQLLIELRLQVARYKVERYNTLLQAVQIEAGIFDTLVRGELAKLEQTKAELEKQKLVGQLNQQQLEAYRAQIAGITAKYDLFSKQVEAVVAQYDADRTKVAAFSETVKAYQAKVQAKEAEWRGYAEAVRGEIAKQDSYRISAEIFGQRVQAYATGVQADRARLDAQVEAAKLRLERTNAELERVQKELDAEAKRVEAVLRAKESEVRVFEAEGKVESDRVTSDAQRLRVLVENVRSQMQAQIQETQLKIEEAKNIRALQEEGLKTMASIQASIASSALAALNIGATIQESASNSYSCINRFNTEL
jgi:surface antigen